MKGHSIPNQYYKDLGTGIEMNFTFNRDYGWSVGFMNCNFEDALDYNGHVPFPETPEQYKQEEKEFYDRLHKALKEEE